MRVLIPYDGTKNAENALLELQNGEFGQDDEILVVITDILLAESLEQISRTRRKRRLSLESSGVSSYVPSRREIEEERFLVREIRNRLSTDFPAMNIKVETLPGFSLVTSEVLEKASSWKADLIILGKHKYEVEAESNGYKSGLWRIVSDAQCPVRFAYGADYENFTIRPDYSSATNRESSKSKQVSRNQNTSNDVGGMRNQQAKNSDQGVYSNKLTKEAPNQAVSRLFKQQSVRKRSLNAVKVAA